MNSFTKKSQNFKLWRDAHISFCDRQKKDEKHECLLQFVQNGKKMILHWKSDQVFYEIKKFYT